MASNTIKGLTVALGGDTANLEKSFKRLDERSRGLQRELTQVNKQLKFNPDSTSLLAMKQEVLAEKVEVTRETLKKLKDMQSEVETAAKNGTLGADKYREYKLEVEKTENVLKNLEKQLSETGDKFSEVQRKSGAVTFKNAEDKVEHFKGKVRDMTDAALDNAEKLSKGFDKVGDGLEKVGGVVNKGSAAAAAVLAGSVASFKDLDNGYDVIIKKTGAADGKFESLKQTADELFGNSVFDMTDIGNAIGEVNTRFGYMDEKLKAVTESYLQFAKINDADVSDSVSKTARIMAAWNLSADELPDLLGMITAKGQETGIAVGALMDKVLDNNATFKEMGLNLEQSVTLMAQFEKNGVNDSAALAAMKAAVKNATKEGLSLSEALGKNIDDIKNASTETEALQKATELFGTKGAAEMSNAIREGRIDFDDLSGSMSDYRDTVKKTYDATLDPLEESKQVLNNLKLAGADLAATALKEGKPMLDEVINGIKGVTEWLKKLSPEEKKTLTNAIKLIAVAGPAVTITGKISKGIGNIVGVIPKAINAIKSMTSATKGAEAAQIGLNAAQSASPVGALITLLSLLAAAITTYYLTTDEATMRAAFLTEEEDKLYRRIDDNIEKWKELRETREQASKEIEGQYGYYESLSERLKEITDESGRIRDGYEVEARTIVNVLNDAFGKEYEITGDVIDNYREMQVEIDKLIQLQKAQAELDAFSSEYKTAVSERTDNWQNMVDAEKAVKAKDQKLLELYDELKHIKTGEWVQTSTGRQWVPDKQKEQEKAGILADIKYERGQKENAVEEFQKAQQVYLESINLIRNYEGVVSAIASKDTDAISDALTRMTNDFVTADSATQEMLDGQQERFGDSLAAVSKAIDENAPGISKKMLDEYRNLYSQAQQENRKFTEGAQKTVDDTAQTIEDGKQKMEKAAEEFADPPKIAMQELPIESKKAGGNFVTGFVSALSDGAKSVWNAATNVGKNALDAIKSFLGIRSPSKEAAKLGAYLGEGFSLGIEKESGNVLKAALKLGDTARNGLSHVDLSPAFSALSALKNGSYEGAARTVNNTTTTTNKPVFNVTVNASINSDADIDALTDKIYYSLADKLTQDGRRWG